jgi:hypothetical protein
MFASVHRPGQPRARSSRPLPLGALLLLASCASQPAASPGTPSSPADQSAPAPANTGAGSAATTEVTQGASLFAVHWVSDFEAFKKYLDEGAAERAKAGVTGYLLSRMDDGRIVIHFVANDVKEAQAALNSERLQEYLSRSGKPDASLVWLTHNELLKVPASPPAGATFSLLYKVSVADFNALKSRFAALEAVFVEQSAIGWGLHRSSSRDDIVVLHFMGTDRQKLEALSQRPEFVEMMKLAQPKDAPQPLLGADVARSRPK